VRTKLSVIVPLGLTQTLAWASSYYLLAILADPIARDTQMSRTAVFAAFSGALLVSASAGPHVGATIDKFGGRLVLVLSNICFAVGLALLAISAWWLPVCLAWLFIGIGMGLGLYDAAFAALARLYGVSARLPITAITLMAGFASTVGWPLTAWSLGSFGWRETCLGWALVHLAAGIPLNASLPSAKSLSGPESLPTRPALVLDRTMWLLAFAFAAGWTISTAMAAHLPKLLASAGASPSEALLAGVLIGPAQVAARLADASFLRRFHPLLSARLAAALHPIGVWLLVFGAGAVPAFALLHGAGNGILTIARGTVPLAIYGPESYGYRLGILGVPSRVAQAGAPLAFAVLIDAFGEGAFLFSAVLGIAALAALCMVRTPAR
jgi:predicted MFS family arabinose efflux permease